MKNYKNYLIIIVWSIFIGIISIIKISSNLNITDILFLLTIYIFGIISIIIIKLQQNKLITDNLKLNNNLIEHREEVTQQNEELLLQTEDLHQQKKIIEKSKATLEAIYNGVSDAIFLMNDEKFVDCNTATLKIFDCKREEIIGASPSLFSPKYQPNQKLSSKIANEYISKVVQGEPQSFEWIHITKKSKEFIAEVNLNKINIDNELLILAVVRDVTKHVKSREELQELNTKLEEQHELMQQVNEKMFAQNQEIILQQDFMEREKAKFEAIYKGANDAVFLINNDKITDCNNATLELFNCQKEDIIGALHLDFAPDKQENGELSSNLIKEYLNQAKHGKALRFDWIYKTIDKKIFYAKVSLNKTKINRKTTYIVIVRDITTERKQQNELKKLTQNLRDNQEELQQQNEELHAQSEELLRQKKIIEQEKEKANEASKSKSLFLASMSHEIRTPLNGVIGMLNLLKETRLQERQKEFVNIIDVSSESLLNIINDILDYSKIEANQLHLEKIPVDLIQISKEVIKILQFKAEEKGLILELNIDKNIHQFYKADPVRLKQILINYCNNAIKFTEKGSVKINIYELKNMSKKSTLKFEVVDTGIGISKENQKKLFKEFSQVDNSISRKFGGTGLGLAISMKLAKLMNGEVGLSSIEGKGSTFWFTAELQKIDSLDKKIIELKTELAEGLYILLIEDNIINQKVAIHTLKKNKHIIDIANDGIEGIEKFKKNSYDIILMDIQMPNLNGYETTIEIRKIEKKQNKKRTKIVAMTANAMKGEKEKCIKIGMDDYISKPFKKEDLLRIL